MSETETRVYRQAGAEAFASARECRKSGYSPLFRVFAGFASRSRSRAAKPARYENLKVFIRSDVHAVRAGLNIRGCGPLTTPGFIDRLGRKLSLPPLDSSLFYRVSRYTVLWLTLLVLPYWRPIVATITAFIVCMRFSASSNTFEADERNTSSLTSISVSPN